MTPTLVAFHAHPDDEALLTSGTLARAAAEGHRVVVVVATDGDLGLTSSEYAADGRLGERRLEELRRSAGALGVARVVYLGYADSGLGPETHPDPPGRVRFVRAPLEEAASRLAQVLTEERDDVLAQVLPTARRVLSVGCASGMTEADLVRRGIEVVGIEFNPAAAAVARQRGLHVLEGDATAAEKASEAILRESLTFIEKTAEAPAA